VKDIAASWMSIKDASEHNGREGNTGSSYQLATRPKCARVMLVFPLIDVETLLKESCARSYEGTHLVKAKKLTVVNTNNEEMKGDRAASISHAGTHLGVAKNLNLVNADMEHLLPLPTPKHTTPAHSTIRRLAAHPQATASHAVLNTTELLENILDKLEDPLDIHLSRRAC
jgi:hypothetical protein